MRFFKFWGTERSVILSMVLGFVLICTPFSVGAETKSKVKWFHNLEAGLKEARKNNKWVFVDIGAVWCGPCQRLKKNVIATETVQNFLAKNFVNVELDADKEEVSLLLKQHGVQAIPCLMVFSPKGVLKSKFEGAPETAGAFVKKISSMVKGDGES